MTGLISLDFNGTLARVRGLDWFWREEIPRLYSERSGITFDRAKREVLRDYDEIGPQRAEWYNPRYWFRKYGIDDLLAEASMRLARSTTIYPDVNGLLPLKGVRFVVCSRAWPELIYPALSLAGLKPSAVYSPSDFGHASKNREFWVRVRSEIESGYDFYLHVGDSPESDYLEPLSAGWKALLLDRQDSFASVSGRIRDLAEIKQYLAGVENTFTEKVAGTDRKSNRSALN